MCVYIPGTLPSFLALHTYLSPVYLLFFFIRAWSKATVIYFSPVVYTVIFKKFKIRFTISNTKQKSRQPTGSST